MSEKIFAYIGTNTTGERNGGSGKGIEVFSICPESGNWEKVQTVATVNPGFLAMNRTKTRLYCAHANRSRVSVYAIEGNGCLRLLSDHPTGGWNTSFLSLGQDDEMLFLANTSTASLSAFLLRGDGDVETLCGFHQIKDELGPLRLTDQICSKPHQIIEDPSGKFLIVPDKGCDCVRTYLYESNKNTFRQVSCLKLRPGWSARHCAFDTQGKFCYILTEFIAAVITCRFDSDTGELTPIQILQCTPDTYVGLFNKGAEIITHPTKKFVYASNRGYNGISAYQADAQSGKLRQIGNYSSYGKVPRHLCIDPGGNFFYAVNESSHTIISFRIDQDTGALEATGQVIHISSPTCMLLTGPVKNVVPAQKETLVSEESEYGKTGYSPSEQTS